MDIFNSKRVLFDTWNGWLAYAKKAATWLLKGVFATFYAIVMGIISLLYRFILFMVAKIREWPLFSFVSLAVVLTVVMVVVFVNVSVKAKTYEHERDSISYELYIIKHTYGLDTIENSR